MEDPARRPLDTLRTRSWEMELLLSGFVLVLLLPLPTYVEEEGVFLLIDVEFGIVQQFLTICYLAGVFGSRILIINLMIYLFLRGFWIGMIGLATAFPQGPDLEKLNYQQRFQAYLNTRITRPEEAIQRLDQLCSSVFSFSFLAIFLLAAFFITLFVMLCILIPLTEISEQFAEGHWVAQTIEVIQIAIISIILLLASAILLDFLSQGLLKKIKKRWFVRLYFPIYRGFRMMTLAPLYTPIYYTLITNVPRRTIFLILVAYFGIFYFTNTYEYDDEVFFPREQNQYQLASRYYEEYLEEKAPTFYPMIPAEYTDKDYLRLFIPYNVNLNDTLAARCPEVVLFEGGLRGDFFINLDLDNKKTGEDSVRYSKANVAAALHCLSSFYRIAIDDTTYPRPTFYFHRRPDNDQTGILTYLPIRRLSSGAHLLTIEAMYSSADSTDESHIAYIPFVRE